MIGSLYKRIKLVDRTQLDVKKDASKSTLITFLSVLTFQMYDSVLVVDTAVQSAMHKTDGDDDLK